MRLRPRLRRCSCRVLWISGAWSRVMTRSSSSLACCSDTWRSSHLTLGRLVAFIDSESKPMAISSMAALGSPAISPQMLTGLPTLWASSTTRLRAWRIDGCR
ncbi:hypothetical protein D3C78_1454260 [compost metagenome]